MLTATSKEFFKEYWIPFVLAIVLSIALQDKFALVWLIGIAFGGIVLQFKSLLHCAGVAVLFCIAAEHLIL